jgi:hypothetical protein
MAVDEYTYKDSNGVS